MKTQLLKITFLAILAFSSLVVFSQGLTTAEINGSVSDQNGEALPGASVVVLHNPTGTQNGTVTNQEGLFRLPNLTVGGPYTIKVSFIGFHSFTEEGVYLALGQSYKINIKLTPDNLEIPEIMVMGSGIDKHDLFDGNRTGAETVINREQLENLPTLTGNLNDFLRLTPQANANGEGMSIAGGNNRYNSLMIDGTVNNDVFGLAANGMNGGQAGVSPISVEAIDQFQVVIAPFDVRQSGFAGGGINAVTKRGTNEVKGSVYYKVRNESLAGKTPGDVDKREKLADFSAKQYGFTVGAPIIKNKLFIFANAEIQRDETPKPFNFSDYRGDSDKATLDQIYDKLQGYSYDAGAYGDVKSKLDGEKFLVKLNWNISDKHSLMVRHQYTKGESSSPSSSNSNNIYFANTGVLFPSTTNASALEFNSRFNDKWSNNLKIGYTHVFDDRAPMGENFPGITISDGSGKIHAGSEVYSSGNQLKQSILTITDNVQLYSGKNTWTIGTHNEFYSIYNMFMRKAFGDYSFDSTDDFLNGTPSYYNIGYSLIDDIRGDGSAAAADFNAIQLGLFIQDEIQVNKDLKITAGLRADVYFLNNDPIARPGFNSTTIPKLEQYYDMKGAQAGKMPSGNIMWSPRVGFNWDVNGDKTTQLRGGVGIFTSRIPFVWPAGSYTNNGMVIGEYKKYDNITFNPDWKTQEKGGSDAPSGSQIDLYAKDFKYPQMLRGNIAVDQKLPGGIIGTLDLMYTKTINNVLWKDVNVKPAWGRATGTGDNRPLYKTYRNGIDTEYGQIMLGDNTNEGYTYNITATLTKRFDIGLDANLSYSYGRAESVFDGTSSQNSSQWNYLVSSPVPRNEAQVGNSIFDMGSRVTASLTYHKEWLKHLKTTVSLFYNGQDGSRFSYIYDDYYGDFTSEAYKGPELMYIPINQDDINLVDPTQWAALDEFIAQDDYLSKHRGEYAERNASRTPWTNIFDMKVVQDIWVNLADRKQTLQFGLDIFNVGNLINKDWGRMYTTSNNNIGLIKFEKLVADPSTGDKTVPTFSYKSPSPNKFEPWYLDDSGISSSLWQAQFTMRYIF
ncbi:TonB-dependent receptor domain-containing protein [uncultured Sunxiuqinia sp.]|uniref:TonB-dependent receptor n=1 Tax=uncultured Sunxiuqinia sp. TaxID=1573825 RepID=UPI002AA7D937|nr:TonB-dependent receptor [uncultured Sunxiuqinia sp.]